MQEETKLYFKEDEVGLYSFPYDWRQTFDHPFDMSRAPSEAQTIKEYIADAADRQAGLEVLKILLDFTFATRAQIQRILSIKGLDTGTGLDALLNKYNTRRLVNKFTISTFEMTSLPDDAFTIYCLDHAARHILSHFYHSDVSATWKSTNAYQSPELVSKYLVTTEFFLSLLTTKGDDFDFFEATPNFLIRSRTIRLSARFCIKNGAAPIDFIFDVIRKSDIPTYWTKKADEQLNQFINEQKYWGRYFQMPPNCIFLAEDLSQAQSVADIFARATGNTDFRITTDAEIMDGIDKATFYKYPKEPGGSLSPVKPPIFKRTR